ncbi:uncharacterized protein LOC131997096 [Stomoxys calcitrans]|uniref:uncharacterized protein LOC131997096 n=1 Tax=Stomoxys calcitrans TaxID=35570 RepID=UPI0027E284A3|nr:uncharacterized protein LOC131997096 [Stomoxys calcitrans]
MKAIIHDMCMYRRLKIDPTSKLQTRNNKLVEKLYNLNLINIQEKNKLTSRTALAPRIYGFPKIHKEDTTLKLICSSINALSYHLCKYMVKILKNITKDSKYNVKDTVDFKANIRNITIDNDEVLVSFDVVSLFPSIPINLPFRTIENKWEEIEKYTNIPREIFKELLTVYMKDSKYFKYDDKLYEQLRGMPMGSPASPIIADIVMEELLNDTFDKMMDKVKFNENVSVNLQSSNHVHVGTFEFNLHHNIPISAINKPSSATLSNTYTINNNLSFQTHSL